MKKRITKRNWYGDEIDGGKAKAPSVAPNDERHLEGLNRGEININDNSDDPTIFIRDNKGNVVGFKPNARIDIEELKKLFLGKYGPDQTDHLLKLLGGALVEGGITADSITSDTANIPKFTERSTFEKGATTLNLLVQELADTYDLNVSHVATMMRTIIKDYVSSETFIPGLTGEGMKIHKALNGDWNLEIDNVVVRKVMTIFELVISKLRSVNGGLVVSAANGRIKSVGETTGEPTYYVLGIEGDMQFVADDLVRCQVFTSGQVKFYWVPVASVTADSILVLKSEFPDGVFPVSGDDLIQMGNLTNKSRQGVLYLTASEDGKPRFSVLDGVNSTSTVGKSKVILGCLDGITDTDFPADFQPSGYGLYAMNVFLKGVFILRNGKSVEDEVNAAKDAAQDAKDKADTVTRLFQEFTVAGGLFESKITEVKTYTDNKVGGLQVGGRNLLKNSGDWHDAGWNDGFRDNGGGYVIDNGVTYNGRPTLKTNVGSGLGHSWLKLENNVEYTYSAMVMCNTAIGSSGSTPLHYHAGRGFYNEGKISILRDDTAVVPNEWRLISITFKLTYDADSFCPFFYRGANGDVVYWIANIKLEKGNKATDWTPAPEDVQSQIDTHGTAIQQNAKAIQLKASQTTVDGLGNRLSTAEGTLGVQAGQISAQVSSISSLTGRMSSAEAKITDDAIRLTVAEQTKNTAIEYANLAAKLAGAKMLYRDPTFKEGMNSIGVYNNSGNGTVSVSRVSSHPDNPTGSAYQIRIVSDGFSNSPNRGGFYFGNHVHVYSEYICKIIAWIPVGSNIIYHSNSIGDGGYQKWLTPTVGQGKWTEYVSYVRGGSQNTSSTNYYAIDSPDQILTWWLCYATVFECSSPDDTPTRDEIKSGIGITAGGITIFGKTISLIGAVTFDSLAGDAKGKINDAQSTANSAWNKAENLKNSLGGLAYDNAVNIAKLDSTIIEGGYIKTNLINARAIVTGSLLAEQIAATNITTGRLTVTDGATIGGFSVSGSRLVNTNFGASISIRDSSNARYVTVGGTSNIVDIASYGSDVTGLYILSNNPEGTGTNYAIRSYGRHIFGQRNGDVWNAPGVLWCGRMAAGGNILSSWGNGLNRTPSISRYAIGKHTITHNLGHTNYYPIAIAEVRNNPGSVIGIIARYVGISANSFSIEFKNNGDGDEDPKEFQVMIFGRNVW